MKYIQYLIFFFVLVACKNNTTKAQEQNLSLVGKYDENGLVLTIDKSAMLKTYNANLIKHAGIEGNFTDVILKETTEKEIILVFKGEMYISTFSVTALNANLYAINTISCTTSDCASEAFGCTPRANGVACWPCSNKGKCTKTVTSFSLLD